MSFQRYIGADTKYQGTSFIRTLTRKDKLVWAPTHTARWVLVDDTEAIILSGTLDKVNGDFGFYLEMADEDTVALEGVYLLVAYLEDSSNTSADDIIMEYTLVYNPVKAK